VNKTRAEQYKGANDAGKEKSEGPQSGPRLAPSPLYSGERAGVKGILFLIQIQILF